jgi:hypothetical protein
MTVEERRTNEPELTRQIARNRNGLNDKVYNDAQTAKKAAA